MENLRQLEDNVQESFKLVKDDVSNLKDKLIEVSQNQIKILKSLEQLENKEKTLDDKFKKIKKSKTKVINKIVINKTKKKHFIASKSGKTFHEVNCPYGKNIKPRMKLIFKRKNTALNAGYKPCKCVKL